MLRKFHWLVFPLCLSILGDSYKVGLLLSSKYSYKTVLKDIATYAVSEINNSSNTNVVLIVQEYKPTTQGILDASCLLAARNPSTVVTTGSSTAASVLGDLFTSLKIPLIDVAATDPFLINKDYLIRLSPSDRYQSEVIFDILEHFGWTDITILASGDNYGIHGTLYLQHLVTQNSNYKLVNVLYFRKSNIESFDVTDKLEHVRDSLSTVIVLNCDILYAREVLKSAYDMGLVRAGYVWIVTDAITGNPEVLSYNGIYMSYYEGIIGVRPSINKNRIYDTFKDNYLFHNTEARNEDLTIYTLLTYDAIRLVHKALSSLPTLTSPNIKSCTSSEGWSEGHDVLASLKKINYHGVTGRINFVDSGERTPVSYDILNFKDDIFQKVGYWDNTSHLQMTGSVTFLGHVSDIPRVTTSTLTNQHFKIGIKASEPFAYESTEHCTGNACWTGICPEMVQKLASDLNFTYEYLKNGKYGGYNKTNGKWNGLVGDIVDKRIDMITINLSASSARKSVIDFAYPFMDAGISAAVKAESGTSNAFFFLSPFNSIVWIVIILMYFSVTSFMWLFNQLSPYDKQSNKIHAMMTCSCDSCFKLRAENGYTFEENKQFACLVKETEDKERVTDLSFLYAAWTGATGLVNKANGILPHCVSGRFIVFSWWFFMLIVVSMYTANLTASLTLDNFGIGLSGVKDLVTQSTYDWGVRGSTYIADLLLYNRDSTYVKIAEEGLTLDNFTAGLEKLRNGKFVLIDETPTLAHYLQRDCDIITVGSEFNTFEYAFGFPKQSPYADLINKYIIKYREEGYVNELWAKWSGGTGASCSSRVGEKMTFDIHTLRGLFYMLIMGIATGTIIIIVEFLAVAVKDCRNNGKLTFAKAVKLRIHAKMESIVCEWFGRKLTKTRSNSILPTDRSDLDPDRIYRIRIQSDCDSDAMNHAISAKNSR